MPQKFQLNAPYKPAGDQPKAIRSLVEGISENQKNQTLLGVTGSGKTFTMASIIQETQKPALIMSHNKTLAAQLAEEFKEFFPKNAVEYFVSYYDYYQPEAYIARSDTYIAKDASINEEIDRLRHATMESVLTRPDVIIVASVSCIYGIGAPEDYLNLRLELKTGQKKPRREILSHLALLQYTRNDMDLVRGTYRVRGDTIDIHPASEDYIVRIEAFGPNIERIMHMDGLTGEVLEETNTTNIFPATFFITSAEKQSTALESIRQELAEQLASLNKRNKLLEAERLEQRTKYDLEMLEQLGYVSGVENYSRHMDGRQPGEPPATLIDYFHHQFGKNGFLTMIDESHMTIPQIGAMYGGDKARKDNLVAYGFRLPSARDNRPLKFNEWEDRIGQLIFVSATPADYEKNTSTNTVEQIVRPTGLLDPTIEIKPTEHQIDNVIEEIQLRIKKKERTLVTTLTKRMAEELSTFLVEMNIKAAYIHSDVDNLERLEILHDLRLGKYDVLVGINLLREGLDLPEVSLVAIMDTDKEGYLRSETSLVQTIGRAARHAEGHVIMYADKITGSMDRAITETKRRRQIQEEHNKEHHITPKTIQKEIRQSILQGAPNKKDQKIPNNLSPEEKQRIIKELTQKMDLAAKNLDFEQAAELRDTITKVRKENAN